MKCVMSAMVLLTACLAFEPAAATSGWVELFSGDSTAEGWIKRRFVDHSECP